MGLVSMQMEYDLYNTPLPNVFIDDYMPYANPTFTAVYVMGFRHCFHGNAEMNSKELSQMLGISEEFVIKAWKHWQTEGIIKINDETDENFSIEFLVIEPRQKSKLAKLRKKSSSDDKDVILLEEKQTAETAVTEARPIEPRPTETRPAYTVPELNMYASKSSEIRELFVLTEKLFAKPLSFNEMSTIFSFYEWLRLPVEVIIVMLDYCVSNDHRGMRYIERVAIDWADNNIATVEDAELYIKLFNNDYREILKAFGQGRREPTPKEVAYMKKWLKEFKMPLDIVKEACEKTIAQTGQAKFSYADKIIIDWFEREIRTLNGIKAYEDEYRKRQSSDKADNHDTKHTKKTAKNRFANFESREVDFDTIEKMERELLMKSIRDS